MIAVRETVQDATAKVRHFTVTSIVRNSLIFLLSLMSGVTFAEGETTTTCFENISLELSSFESGVCQWKTDALAAANTQTTTRFVPYCPVSYTAYCDRLVLGPGNVAPVKIFLYDKSKHVWRVPKNNVLAAVANGVLMTRRLNSPHMKLRSMFPDYRQIRSIPAVAENRLIC